MADLLYDVLRVNDLDANIIGGLIKQDQWAWATDTSKLIARDALGYHKIPSEGINTYFNNLAAGYTSSPVYTEALNVNGNIFATSSNSYIEIYSDKETVIGSLTDANIQVGTGSGNGNITLRQFDSGNGSSTLTMGTSYWAERYNASAAITGDLFIGDSVAQIRHYDPAVSANNSYLAASSGEARVGPALKIITTAGDTNITSTGLSGTDASGTYSIDSEYMNTSLTSGLAAVSIAGIQSIFASGTSLANSIQINSGLKNIKIIDATYTTTYGINSLDVNTTSGNIGLSNAGLLATFGSSSITHTPASVASNNGTSNVTLRPGIGLSMTPVSSPGHQESLLFYDDDYKCYTQYNDRTSVANQIGREVWRRVKNNLGTTQLNGKVVYINGNDGTALTFGLANAESAAKSQGTIGFLTEDIDNTEEGEVTTLGTVRGINTFGYTAGSPIYLSDTTDGGFTTSPPSSPAYLVRLGSIGVVDAVNGTIEVAVSIGNNTQSVIEIFNGTILEARTVNVTSNGTTISCTLEKAGGGDLTLFFNGTFTAFDSTPAASVTLTAGTDTVPILNYVYILESTNTLTKSTTGFPTAQHVPVAEVLCQSAASLQTYGAYKFHEWTEHLTDTSMQGHLSHVNAWIRGQNATYISGLVPTFSGTGTGTIGLSNTLGTVLQLHSHSFPVFSDPAPIYVVNHPTTPYTRVTNIADIDVDSTGATLDARTAALVFFAVVSQNSSDCKWMCLLPSGSYGQSKPDDTRVDADSYTNYSIPLSFKGTAILVHRLIRSANPGGTTITLYTDSSDDLRGLLPNQTAGGTTGGGGSNWTVSGSDIYYPSGNVGIGTSTPDALLSLGDAVSGQKLLVYDEVGTGSSPYYRYGFGIASGEMRTFFPTAVSGILTWGTISSTDGSTYTELMRLKDTGELSTIELTSGATPATGFGNWYCKTDGLPYFKNDAGTEISLSPQTICSYQFGRLFNSLLINGLSIPASGAYEEDATTDPDMPLAITCAGDVTAISIHSNTWSTTSALLEIRINGTEYTVGTVTTNKHSFTSFTDTIPTLAAGDDVDFIFRSVTGGSTLKGCAIVLKVE